RPTLWDLLTGNIRKIVVRVEQLPIPKHFLGKSYDQDEAYRAEFQQWVNQLWLDKDDLIDRLRVTN
ncbi:MAG: acyltransferase, partial [Moraxellaceae bacterium]|nr:acyltransferase [Moraxellaceae bacterium]